MRASVFMTDSTPHGLDGGLAVFGYYFGQDGTPFRVAVSELEKELRGVLRFSLVYGQAPIETAPVGHGVLSTSHDALLVIRPGYAEALALLREAGAGPQPGLFGGTVAGSGAPDWEEFAANSAQFLRLSFEPEEAPDSPAFEPDRGQLRLRLEDMELADSPKPRPGLLEKLAMSLPGW